MTRSMPEHLAVFRGLIDAQGVVAAKGAAVEAAAAAAHAARDAEARLIKELEAAEKTSQAAANQVVKTFGTMDYYNTLFCAGGWLYRVELRPSGPYVHVIRDVVLLDTSRLAAISYDLETVLAEIYYQSQANHTAPAHLIVANMCDDTLDKSGALLGRVRDRALRLREAATAGSPKS